MKTSVTSLRVVREREDGEEVVCLACIRDPKRDEKGMKVYDENGHFIFEPKSRLRTRMLEDYLRKRIVVMIPEELVTEVKDEFFAYAESYPGRKLPMFTSLLNDVTKVHYDLSLQEGRRLTLLLYLAAYRCLRECEEEVKKIVSTA